MSQPSDSMMKDGKCRLVPLSQIKPIDLQRDELVKEIVCQAREVQAELVHFKKGLLDDIAAFVQLSAETYDLKVGGTKGNLTLYSFDQSLKVVRQVQDFLTFDERIQIAKGLIDECVREWSAESDPKIKALIEHAFQVDKTGKLSIERVLSLRKIQIADARWSKAMQAIADSIQVVASKTYVRIYERVNDPNILGSDEWKPISLDLASLEVPHD